MVYVFLAGGFEEIEAISSIDILRRAGLEVTTVCVGSEPFVAGAHGVIVKADKNISELDLTERPEMLVFPGGATSTERMLFNKRMENYILAVAADESVKVAAICAAPSVIGFYGLLRGRRATCYPGYEDRLIGAIHADESVVRDGRFLTGVGPGVSIEFALAAVEMICGKEKADEIANAMQIR